MISSLKRSSAAGSYNQSNLSQLRERLRRARVISFDSSTWRAVVRLDGSIASVEMPVLESVDLYTMTVQVDEKDFVVMLLDDTNPEDGVVLGSYGDVNVGLSSTEYFAMVGF